MNATLESKDSCKHLSITPPPPPLQALYTQVCTHLHTHNKWVNSSSTLLLAITVEGRISAAGLSSRKKKPGSYVTSAWSWQAPRNRAACRKGKLGHSFNDCNSP